MRHELTRAAINGRTEIFIAVPAMNWIGQGIPCQTQWDIISGVAACCRQFKPIAKRILKDMACGVAKNGGQSPPLHDDRDVATSPGVLSERSTLFQLPAGGGPWQKDREPPIDSLTKPQPPDTMPRPVTLFTGQWADLPLETILRRPRRSATMASNSPAGAITSKSPRPIRHTAMPGAPCSEARAAMLRDLHAPRRPGRLRQHRRAPQVDPAGLF